MQTTVFTLKTPICKCEPVNLECRGKIGAHFISTLAMSIISNAENVPLGNKQCHPQLMCFLLMTWFVNYSVIRKIDLNNL